MIDQKVLDSIAHLSPEKRELVLKKLQQKKQQKQENNKIEGISREDKIPLSHAQEWLWKSDLLHPDSSNTYNLSKILRFRGQLDVGILEKALNQIIKRHEILRTAFKTRDNHPVQEILNELELSIPFIDLQPLPDREKSFELERIFAREKTHIFDLTKSPLLKASLLRLEEDYHALLLTIHHIIIDGWSLGILIQELSILYSSLSLNQPAKLPELPIQYADFASWQRQELTGEKLNRQLSYWREQLRDVPPLLLLPTDRPRASSPNLRGEKEYFNLSSHLVAQLKSLSQKSGTTPYVILLSAFAVLLARYSHQEDLVIGSAIANRNRKELEPLMGLFANTLPLRLKLAGNESFTQLIARVRQVVRDAFAHPDITLEKLLQTLPIPTNANHPPLFQVMFVLQNAPMPTFKLPDLELEPIEIEGIAAHFDLVLAIKETESGIGGVWEYNPDLFDAATIQRAIGHFQTLLSAIAANPQEAIAQLPILSASERQQLLVEWNDTQTPSLAELSLPQLFERQVEQNPNAIALAFQERQITYQQLKQRADRLASHLRQLGVKPETLVGLFLERSLEAIVAILGIWKAGGAYLPLDPNYPPERLAYILEDAQINLLLTQADLLSQLPEYQGQTISLEGEWEKIAQSSPANLGIVPKPEHLAYVIYTSGSTGKPKGVLVTHKGLGNLAQTQAQIFGVSPDSRILQFASSSFDASVSEMGMALASGARLYLDTAANLLPGKNLIDLFAREAITHVTLPPSVLAALPDAELPDLTTIVAAGEACPPQVRARWARGRKFFNAYGPTEVTVCATIADLSGEAETISIGRAIANTQVYVLDSHLQPAPIGVPGEIHVGGIGVARGYLNQPELTAAKFIPNPFPQGGRERLYKTGDLGKYLPDGKIEFLGRIDNQIKIRGFRVELGEIEAVLRENSKIKEVAVITRPGPQEDKQIAAYLVPAQAQAPSSNELRYFLKQKLPEYMVPSTFEVLEAMPLTPNGKIDRQMLGALTQVSLKRNAGSDGDSYVAPQNDLERTIAEIWQEVLNLEQVGINSNFFDLGGNSLLVAKVTQKLNRVFPRELSMVELFQYPTISALAQYLSRGQHPPGAFKESEERAHKQKLSQQQQKKRKLNFTKLP